MAIPASEVRHEVLVIGSGAAGLSLALRLAEAGREVAILSKAELSQGSTRYAQGGISAVLAGARARPGGSWPY